MSSSNRDAGEFDATVYQNERPVGPMRLPMKSSSSFVKQFNRIYSKHRYSLIAVPKTESIVDPSSTTDSANRHPDERESQ